MSKEPVLKKRGAFRVVGVERFTEMGIPAIQEAWEEFTKRNSEISNSIGHSVYGIEDYSRDFDMNNGGFPKYYYIASLEVGMLINIPAGMKGKEIPAANYAVFSYRGALSGLHDFFGFIYGEWMPKSGYSMDPKLSLDFECYNEPVMDMNDAQVEIWVPIVKE
ncbi:MAG: GyrI-like domain-containing protein [Ignavibacteriota bacterium]